MSDILGRLRRNRRPTRSILQDFGIGILKPKVQRTAEETAISAAKARQTRAAHEIMGTKQRATITVAGSPDVTLVGPTGLAEPCLTTKPTPSPDLSGMEPPVVPTAPNGGAASGSTPRCGHARHRRGVGQCGRPVLAR